MNKLKKKHRMDFVNKILTFCSLRCSLMCCHFLKSIIEYMNSHIFVLSYIDLVCSGGN